jgi:hypothetical protein
MLPWRYRVVPRAVSFRAAILAWLVALIPILGATIAYGERTQSGRPTSVDPAPLYVGPGVRAIQAEWVRNAMAVAWQDVPTKLGLPLPDEDVAVRLFADRHEISIHLERLLNTPPLVQAPACLARISLHVIWCDASTFYSPEGAIAMIAHELTHHVTYAALDGQARLPSWYDEGLAEYVAIQVLVEHLQRVAAEDQAREGLEAGWQWSWDESLVADELRLGRHLILDQRWAAGNLEYARAVLAIRWLVERYGMDAVVGVVRETRRTGSFASAFVDSFGLTTIGFEQQYEADVRTRLLAQSP